MADLAECKKRVQRKYIAITLSPDARYNEILDEIYNTKLNEWNAELDKPYTQDITGRCNGVPYNCKAGQTRRQCEPESCQEIGKPDKAFLGIEAEEKYIQEKIDQECV